MKKKVFLFISIVAIFRSVIFAQHILPVYSSSNNRGFIENKGQIIDQQGNSNEKVVAIYPAEGFNLILRNDGFSYDIYEIENGILTSEQLGKFNLPEKYKVKYQRIDVQFLNPDTSLKVLALNRICNKNYYNNINYPDGILNAGVYDQVVYKNIYAGIDLIFYTDRSNSKCQLKYNFIIRQGADINQIKLKYKGLQYFPIFGNKNQCTSIEFRLADAYFTESIPESWILNNDGNKEKVIVNYQAYENGVLGFALNDTKLNSGDLIIDPVPVYTWGTYYGGNNDDFARFIKTDKNGNIYLCGYTYSLDCIATSGAFISTFAGGSFDGFIAKLNSSGNRIWATYFGGSNNDDACSVTFDSYNNLYIAGYTRSGTNITTAGSHQSAFGGGYIDAFMAKFDSNGSRIWSTYIGGSGYDWGYTITADQDDNIIIAGRTTSINNITTPGCYQQIQGGNSDAFIQRFTTSGSRVWGTYLGGAGDDYGFSLVADNNSYVYLAGHTSSTGGIVYGNSFQTYFGGGNMDAFLAKICTCGPFVWCTYYGGNEDDEGWSVTTDNKGSVYLAGVTASRNAISTPNSFQDTLYRYSDAFLAKFTDYGNRLWGTYFGGDSTDGALSLTCSNNSIFITGYTFSSDLTTSGILSDTLQGSSDAYLASFDLNGKGITSAYFGGIDYDEGLSIASDQYNNIYLCGYTASATGIATSGTYQDTFKGGSFDAFVKKYRDPCYGFNVSTAFIKNAGCYGKNNASAGINISAGTKPYRYLWSSGDTLAIADDLFAGQYICHVSDSFGCMDSISITIEAPDLLDVYINQKNVSCNGGKDGSIKLSVSGGTLPYRYIWNNGDTINNITSLKADTHFCVVIDSNLCIDTVTIVISEPDKIQFSKSITEPLCYGNANGEIWVKASGGIPPYRYFWNQGDTNFKITNLVSGSYNLRVTDSNNCSDSLSIQLNQPDKLQITFQKGDDTGPCNGFAIANVQGGTAGYNYQWKPGYYTDSAIYNLCFGIYQLTVYDVNGCNATDSVEISNKASNKNQSIIPMIKCYPNPTFDNLNIELSETLLDFSITVSDPSGKVLFSNTFESDRKINLNLKYLHAGIYFLAVKSNIPFYQYNFKLIIKE